MSGITRRTALTAALLSGATIAHADDEATPPETPEFTEDQQRVMQAGLTAEEADCWKKTAEAAGALFQLPQLHPMDRQEVAAAIHVIQNKLLSRPTYRKYLEIAKQGNGDT